jgi:uncharacterized membrane protein YbhN (UPF0104 family)
VTSKPARSGLWSWLVLATVLVAAAYLVQRNAAEIADTYAAMGWPALAGAGLLAFGGTLTIGMVWRSLLLGMETARVPAVDHLATFYVTQLGKYVPGAVWPIVAQVAAAGRWGYRRASVVSANLLMMFLLSATGVLLGLLLLPWFADFGRPWLAWAVVAVPVLAWSLWPGSAASVLRRLPLPVRWRLDVPVTPQASLSALGWSVLTWVLLGGQLWLLLDAAGGDGASTVAAALGGVGLAYAVGLVVVVAPAGAGAREAVLVAVCAPIVGAASALAVALACRLLLTLADVVLAVAGSLRGATGRAARSAPGREGSE